MENLKQYEEFYALLEQQNVALVKLKWAVGDRLLELRQENLLALRQIEMVKPSAQEGPAQTRAWDDTGYAGNLREWIKARHLPGDKIRSIKEVRELSRSLEHLSDDLAWNVKSAKDAVEVILGCHDKRFVNETLVNECIDAFDAAYKAKGT